eukprot:scaffold259785_cov14-Tisochrysis_lutea.AAC.1
MQGPDLVPLQMAAMDVAHQAEHGALQVVVAVLLLLTVLHGGVSWAVVGGVAEGVGGPGAALWRLGAGPPLARRRCGAGAAAAPCLVHSAAVHLEPAPAAPTA